MYKPALFIGFFLLIMPGLAWAQTPVCSSQGYTVVFVNGIFDSQPQAEQNRKVLQGNLPPQYLGQPVTVQLGYNPSHIAGAGDLAQTTAQLFSKSISNFDLDTILLEIYPEVTTRKLMLVGHSQGSFYTNDMYNYLLSHGEPQDAVGVYNVGSPAAYTAGHGKYLNSSNDMLLQSLRDAHFDILPNNIDIPPTGTGNISGHGFVEDYLGLAGDRVVSDIDSEMANLKPTYPSERGDCFTKPDTNAGYKTEAVAFAVADPTASAVKVGAVAVYHVGSVAVATAGKVALGGLQFFTDTITVTFSPPTDEQKTQDTEKIINKLYGSSLDGLSPEDKKDLLGNSQGSAVVLAVPQHKPLAIKGGLVEGTSTVAATTTPAKPKNIFPDSSNGPVLGVGSGGPGGAPEPVFVAAAIVTPEVSDSTPPVVVPDESTSTTPADVTPPPALPTGAPFTDNFDSYDGSSWTVWPDRNHFTLFGIDNGTADPYNTDPTIINDCHSGECIIANGGVGGLGTFGSAAVMYKETGVAQAQGAFTLWVRARREYQFAGANVGLCIGVLQGCTTPNVFIFGDIAPQDNTWHQNYFAWRQGATAFEACHLRDDTNAADCSWGDSGLAKGTQIDGVVLQGSPIRSDLGDQVWFDDLAEAPTQ